ncbi:MAG TPA: hypothetical protein VNG33_06065, partial [Polyangiaceae bacterium]|nr:hypothetical protein [Polyangiaceae bacterium]
VCPAGHNVQLKADMWHGGMFREAGGRFAKLIATGPFFDLAFSIEGNVAKVEGNIATEDAFRRCVVLVSNDLPGFVSAALDSPVGVTEVFGNIDDQSFEVQVQGTYDSVLKTVNAGGVIARTFDGLSKLPADGAWRVFAAMRYMNHARWLGYVATHPAQFAGEQLLNLNKVLDVLLGHTSIDGLRTQLQELKLRDEVVQLLAALTHVRNQVDVGHAAVELLAAKEHRDLHRFVIYTMEIVAWLVDHVIELSADGKFEFRPASQGKNKRENTLAKMGELLDLVKPLRPETLLRQ